MPPTLRSFSVPAKEALFRGADSLFVFPGKSGRAWRREHDPRPTTRRAPPFCEGIPCTFAAHQGSRVERRVRTQRVNSNQSLVGRDPIARVCVHQRVGCEPVSSGPLLGREAFAPACVHRQADLASIRLRRIASAPRKLPQVARGFGRADVRSATGDAGGTANRALRPPIFSAAEWDGSVSRRSNGERSISSRSNLGRTAYPLESDPCRPRGSTAASRRS